MESPTAIDRSEHSRGRRGVALLLTLGILLLLTLLALSFTSSQLTENQAARNFCHSAKAEEIALGGLDVAISVLKKDARENSYDHLFERWAIYYPGSDGFAGMHRIMYGGKSLTVDMGAYEFYVNDLARTPSKRLSPGVLLATRPIPSFTPPTF